MKPSVTYIDSKTRKRTAVGVKTGLIGCALFVPSILCAQTSKPMIVRAEQTGDWSLESISPTATTSTGPVFVEIAGQNLGAFGDLVVAEKTPLVQMDFVYGIHPQLAISTATNGGSVSAVSGLLALQSSTTNNGSATFFSRNPARYRAGQGITARFTVIFTTGVAASTQTAGMGDNGDGYFYGYNGTSFGILHKNRSVETWIPQASWNGDKCDGTGPSGFLWDTTKGNVAQIVYPYLGFGNIKFSVQDNITSRFILVHTIRYNNTHAHTQLSNPSLKFKAYVANSGSTTNVKLSIGSIGVFLNGQRTYLGPQFGAANIKTGVTTEVPILSIRNASSFNGIVNTGVLRLRSLSFANDNGTAIGRMRIIKGAAIGGSPSFAPIRGTTADNGVTITAGESIASFDVAGSTGTGGYTVYNALSSRNTNIEVDLTPYNIFITPGEDAILAAECSVSTSFGISLNWNEDN